LCVYSPTIPLLLCAYIVPQYESIETLSSSRQQTDYSVIMSQYKRIKEIMNL
jgi:hypothetical protein